MLQFRCVLTSFLFQKSPPPLPPAQAAGEMQRRWRDGSLEEDLPMRGLSEMFNVNYFLVSQVGGGHSVERGCG